MARTPVTDPAGPQGEQWMRQCQGVLRKAVDMRYQGWHHSDDDFAQDKADVHIATAAYTACGTGMKRGYLRPTEFTAWHVRKGETDSSPASTSYLWLDPITVEGFLMFRTAAADTNGVPAENQDVTVTFKQGSRTITEHATTDDAGHFSVTVQDPALVPGPSSSGGRWTVTAVHTPSSAAVWKAPDVHTTITVHPIQVGVRIVHTPGTIGYWGKPFRVDFSKPFRSAYESPPLFYNSKPWLYMTLDTHPGGKFTVMDEANLIDDLHIEMWVTAIDNDGNDVVGRGGMDSWSAGSGKTSPRRTRGSRRTMAVRRAGTLSASGTTSRSQQRLWRAGRESARRSRPATTPSRSRSPHSTCHP